MDSVLVVCYSYSGTSRRAAQLLCSHTGWPLGEVFDVGPRSTLRCVLDSLLHRCPEVRYDGPAPGDFRTVVLVAPVWMLRLAAPMRSFVYGHREALRRVGVVIVMGSRGASNAIAEIAAMTGHAPVATTVLAQRDVEDGSGTPSLLALGELLRNGRARRTAVPEQTVPLAH